MAKVICTLENAAELINGIRFITHADGMISEEVSEEQAQRFARISGYKLAPGRGGDAEVETGANRTSISAQDVVEYLTAQCGPGLTFYPTEADLKDIVRGYLARDRAAKEKAEADAKAETRKAAAAAKAAGAKGADTAPAAATSTPAPAAATAPPAGSASAAGTKDLL